MKEVIMKNILLWTMVALAVSACGVRGELYRPTEAQAQAEPAK